ncbi:MAG: uL15 family ribosomal protein [Crenarchaeota archaeon]|nr:uL15 family ribosomal protein [Thermoproteota archaeon]MCR8455046.1 uL15 family ribosomal protein [Thermoproteota archaeon]MCR8473750.1 uL15 family ribosomal protein [Thermoproteota archaeon]MCR8487202.1 uL15 family ribosomal protein [Thermoproteota archaeon]MCR8501048.1 uL15 family ribosomal protein [Thermoproteota archaeon]
MKIRYKKKQRKSHKKYGEKYRGYGQVGRHRHHPGGRGMAGVKDHMKLMLMKQGYELGKYGFTRHGTKLSYETVNIGEIYEKALDGKIRYYVEDGKLVIDLSSKRHLKILGRGRVEKPIKLVIHESSVISEKAKAKVESMGGEVIVAK